MSTFIALPKKSKLEIADSEIQSIEDKRQLSWRSLLKVGSLLAGALIPPIGTLIDLGFSQIELLQPTATSLELSAESTSNFIPLNSLGAYLVSSIDKQKIEDAQESFDKSDYVIVPDVQLSLSEPICSENVFWRGRQVHWPPESGIHEAHSRRVTGAGVLVGVLDTGCDADHIQLRRKRIDFRYRYHITPSLRIYMRSAVLMSTDTAHMFVGLFQGTTLEWLQMQISWLPQLFKARPVKQAWRVLLEALTGCSLKLVVTQILVNLL